MKYAEVQVRIPNLEGDGIAEVHTISVPVTLDPDTGEELLTEEAVEMIDNTKARYMGLLLPREIKALRQRLELTQKQMSELLQAGEKSYTRWESGKARPSRMVNLLLRALYDGELTPDQLLRIGGPRPHTPEPSPLSDSITVWAHTIDTGFDDSQWELFPKAVAAPSPATLKVFTHQSDAFVPSRSQASLEECARQNKEHRQKFFENHEKYEAFA